MLNRILVLLFCCYANSAIAMDKTEEARWAEDLDALHEGLIAGHIDLYHQISASAFQAELDRIKSDLGSLTPIQAEVAIWRALHMIGGGVSDGHTSVLLDFRRYQWLPLRFAIYGEDVRVVGTTKQHKKLSGMRVVSIGKTPIEDALDQLTDIAQFTENKQSERFFLTTILRCADILFGAGLSEDQQEITMTLQDDRGRRITASLVGDSIANTHNVIDAYPTVAPEIRKPENAFSASLWQTTLNVDSSIYVKFDRYPELEKMEEFGQILATKVRDTKVRNLIIDLRENFGGNGFVGHRLAAAILDENTIDWKYGVYVLTGIQTYSAAMMNAVEYRQILNARLVGEPTGGNPVGYQDSDRFRLPNSGLVISFSKRLYRMQDVATKGVQPDVFVPVRWSDRRAGTDAALEWVVKDITSRSNSE